jgi:hypothetical protein
VARLVRERVASRLAARDAGQARPGWVDALARARPLAGHVNGLRAELAASGVTRTLLVTAGAVGLNAAALVPGEPRLHLLDTPDAGRVAGALEGDLDATALVVAVPPGVDRGGVDAVTAVVQGAMRAEGVDVAARTVAVVPPGGAVPEAATVIEGPADVHHAWTAFTPYALVPGGIAGADVHMLLDLAEQEGYAYDSPENPALLLGALLAGVPGAVDPDGLPLVGLVLDGAQDAHAQLVSTLAGPAVVEHPAWGPVLSVTTDAVGGEEGRELHVHLGGSPTGTLHLLQWAVAAAGHLLGQDPTAPAARDTAVPPLAFRDGAVDVHAGAWLPPGTAGVGDALLALLATGPGPVALHAQLDPELDASVAVLRDRLARRTGRPTTFTWAPGVPPPGALTVQLTGDVLDDGPAPPGPGRDGLRLQLRDRLAGLVVLARAVQDL